jgi:hypothetical protein
VKETVIETERLKLLPHTPDQLRTLYDSAERYETQFGLLPAKGIREFLVSDDVSPEFIEKLKAAKSFDAWTHGFAVLHTEDSVVIGMGGFKGPPTEEGVAEALLKNRALEVICERKS